MSEHTVSGAARAVNPALDLALSFIADGTLSIDDEGRIWRHFENGPGKRRPVEPRRAEHPTAKGYLAVAMYLPGSYSNGGRRTVKVLAHVLIWTHLNGPIPPGLQVNHKDLNKQNNRPDNLELLTGAGNIQHSYANGRTRPWSKATEWRPGVARKTPEQIQRMFELRRQGKTLPEICESENVSRTHLQRILKRGEVTK